MATMWRDALLIGHAQIDSEHKKLVQAIDRLLEACNKGQGRTKVEETLDFVEAYTRTHFAHEEALQIQYGYPDFAAHKRLHAEYIKTIADMKKEFAKTGGGVAFTAKLNNVLVNWLIQHISNEDKKVGISIGAK